MMQPELLGNPLAWWCELIWMCTKYGTTKRK